MTSCILYSVIFLVYLSYNLHTDFKHWTVTILVRIEKLLKLLYDLPENFIS